MQHRLKVILIPFAEIEKLLNVVDCNLMFSSYEGENSVQIVNLY